MFTTNFFKAMESDFSLYQRENSYNTYVTYDGVERADLRVVKDVDSYYVQKFSPFCKDVGGSPVSGSIYGLTNNTTMYYGGNTTGLFAMHSGVIIGDGNTPPALSDYWLSGNQITDFSAVTSLTTNVNNGKLTGYASYLITNTGASPFTIREIAATVSARLKNTSNDYRVLYERSLLDSPVTIQPGETGVVTYKIEIS